MADSVVSLNQIQLDALREISSIGVGNAVTALAQFVDKKVEMAPPQALIATKNEVPKLVPDENTAITMVGLEMLGEVCGHILLVFEDKNALSLVDLLMGRKPGSAGATLSEIDISALKEVAGVMSGSYLRVLGDMINKTLKMTPPFFDFGAPTKIPEFIAAHSLEEGEVTVCLKSDFWIIEGKTKVCGQIIFIPLAINLRPLLKLLGME